MAKQDREERKRYLSIALCSLLSVKLDGEKTCHSLIRACLLPTARQVPQTKIDGLLGDTHAKYCTVCNNSWHSENQTTVQYTVSVNDTTGAGLS
jgi:hypothetical protein